MNPTRLLNIGLPKHWRSGGFVLLLFLSHFHVVAQCVSKISTFPYSETFEATDGNWTPGGTASDWAWGSPQKQVISYAANGQKCWITGGLTGNKYNDGQASWLQSPCFDFTNLLFPYIKMNVFWEIERRFDGAGFQYSIDNGLTWQNVGAATDTIDCVNLNWFNFSPVTYLAGLATVRDGWSGNQQSTVGSCQGGFGSHGWIGARKVMKNLAGKPSVIFRFIFGAGTTCNSYDGFAVDDIVIENAPPYSANFSYKCVNNTEVAFTNISLNCPANFSWNFGDPASGSNNTSALENPAHTFSAPGTYTVTLTVSGPNGATSVATQTVNVVVLQTGVSVISQVKCNGGNDGIATVNVINGTGPFNYSWNTNPVQTNQTAINLSAGSYTVKVSSAGSCDVSANVTISEPSKLQHTASVRAATCGNNNGSATITETGGVLPYTYTWSPTGGNAANATSLAPGNYIVTVKDANQCEDTVHITIDNSNGFPLVINKKEVTCYGKSDGSATVLPPAGSSYTYAWMPTGGNGATASGLAAGTYTVTVTDGNGCASTASVVVNQPQVLQTQMTTVPAFCGQSNGKAFVVATGGTMPYSYTWSSPNGNEANIQNLGVGKYYVTVSDSSGCVKQDSVSISDSARLAIKPRLGNDTTICPGERLLLYAGKYAQYLWQNGSAKDTLGLTTSGTYWVKVTDTLGCTSSDTITVTVACQDIVFPSAFTPNGDGRNDLFGPLGTLGAVSNYSLQVFNRWGQVVFTTNDPWQKWNGKLKGKDSDSGTFIFISSYSFNRKPVKMQKGTIVLLR